MTHNSKRQIIGVVALLSSLVLWWGPIKATYALAVAREEYTHILLIWPVTLGLIALEWKEQRLSPAPGWRLAAPLFLISSLLWLISTRMDASLFADVRLAFSMMALVLCWIAIFAFCCGTTACYQFLFPLAFMFWLVPFPESLLTDIVALLQRGSGAAAHGLFFLAGVPVTASGMRLTIPGVTIEVARECSSIRSSSMLLVATMVIAHLALRSFWRKSLLIAAAVPLSIFKNGLRIFVIMMLGTRVDPGFLTGRFHHDGGIVFFLFSIVLIFIVLWVLWRGEARASVSAVAPGRTGVL